MTLYTEGDLRIEFPSWASVRKFDDKNHGLSHCMKSVDFIVETKDKFIFIEFKDPQHPRSNESADDFISDKLFNELTYKYRDSFLYEWASEVPSKPIYYYVLVAIETLTEADLINRTDALKRALPFNGPLSGAWRRKIVADCAVFNIASWNKRLSSYPISRITSQNSRQ